ncbi:MAG: hypothetical protein GY749_15965 [Desulfobacteraceae bacterium]|nr:hypothetical protein [Desulfobacteraceae bacterium]
MKQFSEKHGADAVADSAVKGEILKLAKNDEIPCAVAFQISENLQVSPGQVGKTADILNLRLVKCQLGLFGYKPEKKIVRPQNNADQEIKDAISNALTDGRLQCRSAWDIASQFKIPRMKISGICENLGIKIKACQLGAF